MKPKPTNPAPARTVKLPRPHIAWESFCEGCYCTYDHKEDAEESVIQLPGDRRHKTDSWHRVAIIPLSRKPTASTLRAVQRLLEMTPRELLERLRPAMIDSITPRTPEFAEWHGKRVLSALGLPPLPAPSARGKV